jgi:hypothetical protein
LYLEAGAEVVIRNTEMRDSDIQLPPAYVQEGRSLNIWGPTSTILIEDSKFYNQRGYLRGGALNIG